MSRLYAGTSGFAYATWKPDFYPADVPAAKFLPYYASKLDSTELNVTFRRLAPRASVEKWVAAVPEEFSFAVKAHMRITHSQRLREPEVFVDRFLESLAPFGLKLGPVLFQLPPGMKAEPEVLDAFLAFVHGRVRAAFEFRHESWFARPVYDVLERHGASLCLAESDDLETPEVVTAPFTYLRLRKPPYGSEGLARLASRVSGYLSRGDVYAYFKHEESAQGALDALVLKRLVAS